ncbi:MAG: hypothetical protein MJ078_03285 [Clostridia bacterium]|nr:hypothetical protein [Clostridia bacterium]
MGVCFGLLVFLCIALVSGERIYSIVRICKDKNLGFFASPFAGLCNSLTVFAVVCTVNLMVKIRFFVFIHDVNLISGTGYSLLATLCGVMLFSVAVRTPYSVPHVQYLGFGLFMLAVLLRTLQMAAEEPDTVPYFLAYLYALCAIVSVPVVHKAKTTNAPLGNSLGVASALAVATTVTVVMQRMMSGQLNNVFGCVPFFFFIAASGISHLVYRKESIDPLRLTACTLTVICFCIGKLYMTLT